jgi:hypothetical protein
MKKAFLSLLAVGAIVATAIPAHADPTQFPIGRKCGFDSNTDVTAEAQTQTGVAYFGPLVADASGTVTCQIYVNGVSAGAAARVSSHTTVGNAAAGAGTITYHSNVTDVVDLCTTFVTDGGAQFWYHPAKDTTDVLGSKWESGPVPADTSQCGSAITIDPNPEACPPLLTIDKAANDGNLLSNTWQDCEPYSPII